MLHGMHRMEEYIAGASCVHFACMQQCVELLHPRFVSFSCQARSVSTLCADCCQLFRLTVPLPSLPDTLFFFFKSMEGLFHQLLASPLCMQIAVRCLYRVFPTPFSSLKSMEGLFHLWVFAGAHMEVIMYAGLYIVLSQSVLFSFYILICLAHKKNSEK